MSMLDKPERDLLLQAIGSEYYSEWVRAYLELFQFSRSKEMRDDPESILSIQAKLAEIESKLWKLKKEGSLRAAKLKAKSSLTQSEVVELAGIQLHIFTHKQLIRISRTIVDGIAWRALSYRHSLLTSAARGAGSGAVVEGEKAFDSELGWAARISRANKSIVIVNDLSRFLRIGDLTEIYKGTMIPHEIKKNGKEVRNIITLKRSKKSKLSNQDKRLLELQKLSLTGRIPSESGEIEEMVLHASASSHFSEIKAMIERSTNEVVVQKNIDGCMRMSVINFKSAIRKDSKKRKRHMKAFRHGIWEKGKDIVITHYSWDAAYLDESQNFTRSVAPYSVFPFTDEICMDLMSGSLLIKTELNINLLVQRIASAGWSVSIRNPDEILAEFEQKKPRIFSKKVGLFEVVPDEAILLAHKNGCTVHIPMGWLSRLTMEFVTTDSFITMMDEICDVMQVRKKPMLPFAEFANEKELFN